MNFDTLALVALVLAVIPCGWFLLYLFVYRPLAKQKLASTEPVSVLIPARNEETNIRSTLEAVLANGAETWRGLGKNATEGLAAPGTILPMTALLLGGQVLPFVLLAFAPMLPTGALLCAGLAAALASLPRLIAAWRFQQPISSALLHPLGVIALLAIQWHALGRHFLVIARDGSIHTRVAGPAGELSLRELSAAIDGAIVKAASRATNSTPKPTAFRYP